MYATSTRMTNFVIKNHKDYPHKKCYKIYTNDGFVIQRLFKGLVGLQYPSDRRHKIFGE